MKWVSTQWNDGVKVNATATGFSLVIPSGDGHVNSVQSDLKAPKLGQVITVEYTVKTLDGRPKFAAVDREGPANFSVMLAQGPLEGRLYLAGVAYAILQAALDKGEFIWQIKVRPRFWQDVNGKQNAAEFKRMLPKCKIVQIVFGGKFRAHGVRSKNGRARYALKSFKVK